MNQIRKRLTYANVMSSIAVFLVLGGAAFAAVQLPKNSVGSKQLKKNAVTTAKIKNGAVTASKVNVAGFPKVPSAATADNATNAGHAAGADNATNAGHAASADKATKADTATTAEFAEVAGFTENVMTALVNSDGTLISSVPSGTTSSQISTGIYEVDFHTPIAGCTWSVSDSGDDFVPQLGEVSAVPRAGNEDALFVTRANSSGTLTNGDFYAQLVC